MFTDHNIPADKYAAIVERFGHPYGGEGFMGVAFFKVGRGDEVLTVNNESAVHHRNEAEFWSEDGIYDEIDSIDMIDTELPIFEAWLDAVKSN